MMVTPFDAPLRVCLVLGPLTAVGCGGSGSSVTCGPGTHDSEGQCVVDGPAPTDAVSDSLSSETGDAAIPPDGGADLGPNDTAGDVGTSDPCPATLAVNCATSCGGPTENCALVKCQDNRFLPVTITSLDQFPYVLRSPDRPGRDPNCQPRCGTGNTEYGLAVAIHLPTPAKLRARASAPWVASTLTPELPYCLYPEFGACIYMETAETNVLFATTDPNSPARNLTIEIAPDGACP